MVEYRYQGDRADTNSTFLMVYEIGKENEGLASDRAMIGKNARSDRRMARTAKQELSC